MRGKSPPFPFHSSFPPAGGTLGNLSVGDGLFKIRVGSGLVSMDDPAFPITGRYVFVNPIIPLHEFCETEIPQLAVSLGGTDVGSGDEFTHRSSAFGASGQGGVLNRLAHFEYITAGARFSNMFIFIDRHRMNATPFVRPRTRGTTRGPEIPVPPGETDPF